MLKIPEFVPFDFVALAFLPALGVRRTGAALLRPICHNFNNTSGSPIPWN
jgi:hypothetical protein